MFPARVWLSSGHAAWSHRGALTKHKPPWSILLVMEAQMSRSQRFRTNAEECLRLAEIMKSPQVRAMLIAMAHAWHRLAQDLIYKSVPCAD